MNSSIVISVWDHSSSVYLEPTSTGTVRHPATDLKYSKLWNGTGVGDKKGYYISSDQFTLEHSVKENPRDGNCLFDVLHIQTLQLFSSLAWISALSGLTSANQADCATV